MSKSVIDAFRSEMRHTPTDVVPYLTPQQCRLEELIRWLDVTHRNGKAVTARVAKK